MMEAQGPGKGAICCNVCYSMICLGFLIWGIVALMNIKSDQDASGLWVLVLCMSCCVLCCCSAAVMNADKPSAEEQNEALEMAFAGKGPHELYMKSLKRKPWKAICGFSGLISVIVLGVLGMAKVITNMPHDVALVAVIVGSSLLGYSICMTAFTLCCTATMATPGVNVSNIQDPEAVRNEIANLEAMVGNNEYSPPGNTQEAAKEPTNVDDI